MVTVVETDSVRGGYRITSNEKDGWVPSYVLNLLTSTPRRGPAWTFRKFRKPSFSGSIGRKDSTGSNSINGSPTTPSRPITSLKGLEQLQLNYLISLKYWTFIMLTLQKLNNLIYFRNSSIREIWRESHINIMLPSKISIHQGWV